MIIEAIAGPFYKIIKVMMKGPNKQSNTNNNYKNFRLTETAIDNFPFVGKI